MRKFLVLLAMVTVLLSFNVASAFEYNSNAGIKKMLDVKFQIDKQIELCYELYGNTPDGKECAQINIIAYRDFYGLMQMMAKFSKDPVMAKDPEFISMENCVANTMATLWSSEFNTAPWYRVNTTIALCFDKLGH